MSECNMLGSRTGCSNPALSSASTSRIRSTMRSRPGSSRATWAPDGSSACRCSPTYRSLNLHELMQRVLAGPTSAAGDSSEEHRRIVEAYESGDLPAARAAIVANVETGRQLAFEMIEALGGML